MILRALLRLFGEVALWAVLVTLIAGAVAAGARWSIARRIEPPAIFSGALLGALVFAGLSDRLELPGAVVLDVGRRPLALVWVAVGAAVGILVMWLIRRSRVRTPGGIDGGPGIT